MIIIIDVVKKLPQITSQTSSNLKKFSVRRKKINKMGKTLQMKEQSIQKWMEKEELERIIREYN
jgi:hypothetical protein